MIRSRAATRFDAIIVGAGPAGLQVGSELARHGLQVVVFDPRAGTPVPQAAHVHVLPDETWGAMCRVLPQLDQVTRQHGAPVAPSGAAMLDSELSGHPHAWPDRHQLDRSMYECATRRAALRVERSRATSIVRRGGFWCVAGCRARWLIDASGSSRTTLRSASRLGSIEWLEWGDRRGYASLVLGGIEWPEDRVGHGWRATDGGLVVRNIGGQRMRATLQMKGVDDMPTTPAGFLEWIRHIVPASVSGWIARGSPESAVRTWKCRRSSSILGDAHLRAAGWMAVGDALLTTAPHQGQGLTQIAAQLALVLDVLGSGRGLGAVAERLGEWAEQRVIAATLSEQLDCSDPAA